MGPLASARIVATVPPKQWFGGQDRRSTFSLMHQLEQRFGTTFYQLDTTPFILGTPAEQQESIESLRAFRPQLAISLANAGYALACSVPREGGGRANLFTDVLEIPVIMLWDHGYLAFPALVLSPLAQRPEDSGDDAIRRVRDVINHPLFHHFPIDTAQIAEMRRLGMLTTPNVEFMPTFAYKPFLDYGAAKAPRAYENDVAFLGNVYLSDQYKEDFASVPVAGRVLSEVLAEKRGKPALPAWPLIAERVEALTPDERGASRLDYDQSFFWHFANHTIGNRVNSQGRLETLTQIRQTVAFYGAFVDRGGIPLLKATPGIEYKGYVHFSDELPAVCANSRIVVDVTNAAFITNCSPKPTCCLAAGGFTLFDHKPDALACLGSDAERLMYRDFDELNAKIDYFLTHEAEREALADHYCDLVRRDADYADRVLAPALRILDGAPRGGGRPGLGRRLADLAGRLMGRPQEPAPTPPVRLPPPIDKPRNAVTPVPADIEAARAEIEADWVGAARLPGDPVRIRTAEAPWGYSALIRTARPPVAAERLWIVADVRVERGAAGLALFVDGGSLADEQIVGESDGARRLHFLITRPTMLGLIVRSGGIGGSVVVIEALSLVSEPV